MSSFPECLRPVRHGILMGLLALMFGALWPAYLASHQEFSQFRINATFSSTQQAGIAKEINASSASLYQKREPHTQANSIVREENNRRAIYQHERWRGGGFSRSGAFTTYGLWQLQLGHVHFIGVGLLTVLLLVVVSATRLKSFWKKTFGWTLGMGSLLYPSAWILMGFRATYLGPLAAEASVGWLIEPAVGLLVGSLFALTVIMVVELMGLEKLWMFEYFFESNSL